ncbi:MAG: FAD-dependent monooxygenase [Acidobacteriota bacterium]|nr:FAD-dependent monooxygenase [Acidobacteriota bacterium]
MSVENNNQKIAIVGAGPAGLVAALAAHKLGFEVKVFEQAPDFAKVGGGVMIHSNGQRVLAALGLLESFRPQMVAVTRGIIQAERGIILTDIDFTEINVPHNRVAVVWRYQLQEHLLKAARDLGIEVNFNHRLDSLETVEAETILKFENGERATANIVIAADGVNSKTREASGIEFEKIPIGEGWIRGASEIHPSNQAFREIWGDDGRRFGIAPLSDNKTYFYARVPIGEWETIRDNRLDEWVESWRNFGVDVIEILRGVSDWQKINYSELFEIHAPDWAKPPVFLVGDAAHAMTPNVGQGANSAMVDALILMKMLAQARKNGKTLTDVGREYTNLRRPFVKKIQDTARQSGELAAKTSASAHLARNLIFAASRNLGFLRRRNLLITAGYNPPENEYLGALGK